MPDSPNRLTAPILLTSACLTIMVGCVIVPGLPQAAAGLGVSAPQWLVTLPSLGVILGSPLAGRLISRAGAYATLAGGLLAYALLGAMAPLFLGPVAVYADRLALGVATACVMASGTTLIAQIWPEPGARLRMIAAQGMAIELGGVIFLALGGWLAARDWRYPFLLYLIALALLVAQVLAMPRPPAVARTSGARIVWPLGIYTRACGSMVLFFIAILNLPTQLAAQGIGATGTGLFLSFVSLVAVGAAALLPRMIGRFGARASFLAAFACYGLAHLLFALQPPLAICVAAAVLLGTGFGLSVPLVNHRIIEVSAPQTLGPLLAMLSLALFLGQFLASFAAMIPGPPGLPFMLAALGAGLALVAQYRIP